jgi:hypothetical protein
MLHNKQYYSIKLGRFTSGKLLRVVLKNGQA